MKKKVDVNGAFYTIMWSKSFKYDKYDAQRILPELTGVLCLMVKRTEHDYRPVLYFGCWREGLKIGIKNLFDPTYSRLKNSLERLTQLDLYYKYTIIDQSQLDLKDVMFWLIRCYEPEFNDFMSIRHSGRHKNVYVRELVMAEDSVIENIPRSGV